VILDYFELLLILLLTIFLIKVFSYFSYSVNLIDRPCNRKIHDGDVPNIGGVSIFLGLISALMWTSLISDNLALISAMGIIIIIGIADDYRGLSTTIRIFSQIIAVLIISLDGYLIENLGYILYFFEFKLGLLALFFTIFGVIGIINAVNMSDGIDGLASINSLIILGFISFFALKAGNYNILNFSIIIMVNLVGFLLFNLGFFGKANKIFLGDAGSTFLGFVISVFLIGLTQSSAEHLPPITALWLVAFPVIETLSIILMRIKKGISPFQAGRDHLHHILLDRNFSKYKTLSIILALSLILNIMGIVLSNLNTPHALMFMLFVLAFTLYHKFIMNYANDQ